MARTKKQVELTKVEIFYVDAHEKSMSAEEIALDLDVAVELVQARLDGLKANRGPNAYDLMGKRSSSLVMTPVASEKGDEHRKNTLPESAKSYTHVINPNKRKTV